MVGMGDIVEGENCRILRLMWLRGDLKENAAVFVLNEGVDNVVLGDGIVKEEEAVGGRTDAG